MGRSLANRTDDMNETGPSSTAKQAERDLPTATTESKEIVVPTHHDGDEGDINSNFIYQRLDNVYATRLLTLEPSVEPTAPICCTLMNVNLAKLPKYEALSYVWGDEKPDQPIRIDGKTMLIRKNLMVAMTKMRFPKHPRLLWIDALCIDQGDIDERNKQVRNMATIYRSAIRVLIWLGDSGEDSIAVFNGLRKFLKRYGEYRGDEPDAETTQRPRPKFFFNREATAGFDQKTIEMFRVFCARPWFSRTWVIQEIALGTEATVLCGDDKEAWSVFHDISPSPEFKQLQTIRDIPYSRDATNSFWPSIVEKVLTYSITCGVTDRRDKVYGLLGILDYPSISVDYKKSVEEVYASFSQAVFERAGHVWLLHKFGIQRSIQTLPTWAIDLSVSQQFGLLPRRGPLGRIINIGTWVVHARGGFKIRGFDLFIKGYRIDQIREVGESLDIRPETPDTAKCLAIQDIMGCWELCAYRIENPSFPASLSTAFEATLRAHDNTMNNHFERRWHPKFTAQRYGSICLSRLRKAYTKYRRAADLESSWQNGADAGSPRLSTWDFDKAISYGMECCYGRSFFTTRGGTMGLCNARSKPGDLIVFLYGGIYPFVLRPRDDGSFEMIGDCYVYGFDESELHSSMLCGLREFVIR